MTHLASGVCGCFHTLQTPDSAATVDPSPSSFHFWRWSTGYRAVRLTRANTLRFDRTATQWRFDLNRKRRCVSTHGTVDRPRTDCASHRRRTLIRCRVDVPPIDVRDVSRASLRRTMTSMIREDARRRPRRGTESRGATMSREATQYRWSCQVARSRTPARRPRRWSITMTCTVTTYCVARSYTSTCCACVGARIGIVKQTLISALRSTYYAVVASALHLKKPQKDNLTSSKSVPVIYMLSNKLHRVLITTSRKNNYESWQMRCTAIWMPPDVTPVVLGCFFAKFVLRMFRNSYLRASDVFRCYFPLY